VISDFLKGNVILGVSPLFSVNLVAQSKSSKLSIAENLEASDCTDSCSTDKQSGKSYLSEGSGHEVFGAHRDAVHAEVGQETLRGSKKDEPRSDGLSSCD